LADAREGRTLGNAAIVNRRIALKFEAQSVFLREGGLLFYGGDQVDNFRRAASYVDRILRGAKLAELPVQFPTKFEMIVNLKTAKALGSTVPQSILLRADEVLE
jgi:putative ABC transport system substrate-binding protein